MLAEARAAKDAGAGRFCMGAAWRAPKDRDLDTVCAMVEGVKALGLETCVTLGMLTDAQAQRLKDAGLDYYNHNLDTSPEYYGEIITTRTYQDRLDTLERRARRPASMSAAAASSAWARALDDRIGMIATLASLPAHPESVPINMLVQVEGTPLATGAPLDPLDFVRTIAVARITMPAFHGAAVGRARGHDRRDAGSVLSRRRQFDLLRPEAADHAEPGGGQRPAPDGPARSAADGGLTERLVPPPGPDWYDAGLAHIWLPYAQMKTAAPPLRGRAHAGHAHRARRRARADRRHRLVVDGVPRLQSSRTSARRSSGNWRSCRM